VALVGGALGVMGVDVAVALIALGGGGAYGQYNERHGANHHRPVHPALSEDA
jgi:hypothetical protein